MRVESFALTLILAFSRHREKRRSCQGCPLFEKAHFLKTIAQGGMNPDGTTDDILGDGGVLQWKAPGIFLSLLNLFKHIVRTRITRFFGFNGF
jgi:hypothetical protein